MTPRRAPKLIHIRPIEREAYVTVDALKNFMSTRTDTLMQQISQQVKKAVEAVSSARPVPRFDYMPAPGCEPSYRHAPVASCYHNGGIERDSSC